MTKAQVASHLLTTEVEIAVGETEIFVGNLVVKLEGQNLSGIQDVERGGDDFDRARFKAGILGSSEAGSDFASDADHVLTAEFVRALGGLGIFFRTENNLRDALAVAKVDENESAVVAAGGYPTAEGDFVAGVVRAEGIAMVSAIGHGNRVGQDCSVFFRQRASILLSIASSCRVERFLSFTSGHSWPTTMAWRAPSNSAS